MGEGCNRSTRYIDQMGDLARFRTIYFNPMYVVSIISLTEVAKTRRIIHDSLDENLFKVIGSEQTIITFLPSSRRLYCWIIVTHKLVDLILLNSVKNKSQYSKREVKEGKAVR